MFSLILKLYDLCILVILMPLTGGYFDGIPIIATLYVTTHLILFIDTMHGNQVGGSRTMIDLHCQTS